LIIKPNPSISIVIPIYNEEKVLPQALLELKNLDVEQIIFVDGGSTDKSRVLIQEAGYHCLLSRAGRAKQMNFGSNDSRSDIILYLHIDTSLYSSNISSIRKSYNDGASSGRFNVKLYSSALTYCSISYFINLRSRLSKVSTGDQAIFVRRDLFEEIGGYADIPLMEDVELSKRLRKVGKVACLTDHVVTSSRRWEENGVFTTVYLMWKLRFLYWLGITPEKLSKMYRDAR